MTTTPIGGVFGGGHNCGFCGILIHAGHPHTCWANDNPMQPMQQSFQPSLQPIVDISPVLAELKAIREFLERVVEKHDAKAD